jgi:uncharacterized protein YecE (DUF72 family)
VLGPFLKKVPADRKLAIEIRNRTWLDTVLADLLREHKVALVLQDLSSMPRPWEFKAKFDFVTADFAYVRWLGDRKGIEEQTTTWDKTVVDRRSDLMNWVERSSSWVEGADDGAAHAETCSSSCLIRSDSSVPCSVAHPWLPSAENTFM